ncbi:MAG: hypothetical protein KDH97_05940 [Calditrichaeota bacterium]|nr:hypothetical protein [Calditrichota bacterium]
MPEVIMRLVCVILLLIGSTATFCAGPAEEPQENAAAKKSLKPPLVIAPSYMSLSIGIAGTRHQLGDFTDIVTRVYQADPNGFLTNLQPGNISATSIALQLSLAIHLTHNLHLGMTAHHHLMKEGVNEINDERNSCYLRLTAAELFYLWGRKTFQPWVAVGLANTAVFLKDYQQVRIPDSEGTYEGLEWRTRASTISVAAGARYYLTQKTGWVIALRFFPFPPAKIKKGFSYTHNDLIDLDQVIGQKINLTMLTFSIGFFGNI